MEQTGASAVGAITSKRVALIKAHFNYSSLGKGRMKCTGDGSKNEEVEGGGGGRLSTKTDVFPLIHFEEINLMHTFAEALI